MRRIRIETAREVQEPGAMRTYAISETGLGLIKRFEGFRAEPAELSNDGWVVGYSHVRIAARGSNITETEAVILLRRDLAPVERFVNAKVTVPLTQNQYDALVSFCFSVGQTAFEKSDVLRKVNAGQIAPAACAMDAWRKSAISGEPKVYEVLVRRRAAEKALMLAEGDESAPSAMMRPQEDFSAAILGASLVYGALPVLRPSAPAPANDHGRTITEILKSEPQTALVLTQVITPDDFEDEDDAVIVTAHHRPVARQLDRAAKVQLSADAIGLWALMAFGAGLCLLGAAMFAGGDALSAVVLTLPGVVASGAAGYGFSKAPKLIAA
ncbi:MAG: lysozyme [Caulobacterales bacterium]